jgi:hypothetical protein
VSGLGGTTSGGSPEGGEKPVVNQALDSVMGMAVQMPALKKIGEELGMTMDGTIDGLVSGAMGQDTPNAAETDTDQS